MAKLLIGHNADIRRHQRFLSRLNFCGYRVILLELYCKTLEQAASCPEGSGKTAKV